MERKFYTDDFEQLLKDRSDEFRMYPSKRVWHSIYNDLHPGRKWPSIAVSMFLIIALLMIGYWNNTDTKAAIAAADIQKNNTAANATIAKNNTTSKVISSQQSTATVVNQSLNTQQPFTIYKDNNTVTPAGITASTSNNNNTSTQQQQLVFTPNIPVVSLQDYIAGINFTIAEIYTVANKINNVTENPAAKTSNTIAPASSVNNAPVAIASNNTVSLQTIEKSKKTFATARANATNENNSTVSTDPALKTIAENNEVLKTNTENTTVTNTDADNPDKEKIAAGKQQEIAKAAAATIKNAALTDRPWIENYAFYNKSKRKAWQDRTAVEFYVTPSVGFSRLNNDTKYDPQGTGNMSANATVNQKAALGLEAGFDITYSLAKKIRVKGGLQINYTNYGVKAYETNHPVLTTLMMTDPISGYPTLRSANTSLANNTGTDPVTVHNKTYQVSLPIGLAFKLAGDEKLEWYAGATIQPTFVMGSKAYLISADRKNYVEDNSLTRKWNMNAGFETYFSYKLNNYTLQAGPQLRYQLFSTYLKNYTVSEKLYNVGVKVGILKNF